MNVDKYWILNISRPAQRTATAGLIFCTQLTMEEYNNIGRIHWYQKWWGVFLLSSASVLLLAVIYFGATTARYLWKLKKGQASHLQQQFYGNFNKSISGNSKEELKIKRKDLETADDPFLGNPNAGLVVVVFVDFLCSSCKDSAAITKKLLNKHAYKVKLIVRDFPAESIHPGATTLAQIADCAHQQNRFWEMHDVIFDNQGNFPAVLSDSDIKSLAGLASVDYTQLDQCLKDGKSITEVNKDYSDAIKFGVVGTPTFFVNGQKIQGVVPYETWEKIIQVDIKN